MSDNRVKDFFYSGNAVHGEPDYGLADNFVRTAETFANTTYQSVYIILRLCLLYQNLTPSVSENQRNYIKRNTNKTNMRMKTFLIPFILIVCLFMTACGNEDEPKDKVEEIRIEVSAETGVTYAWTDYNKEHPIECMLVKLPNDPVTWQPMMFGEIEGFTYERGHEYYLSVRRTTLANPPADASCYTYSLIKILSDRVVEEPEVPVDKVVTSIDDIVYQKLCPFDKYAIESLFYINGDGKITYSFGDSAPSYDSARLFLEDILPKDDPNWGKFQTVPYMAFYSYVFSPLTDKVRLVRNESSGPMFEDVVPKDEFNYIVQVSQVNINQSI